MTPPDVAIVGMACVFPGARNVQEYWENILAKVSAIGDPPADWEAELFLDPDVDANDRIYCSRGGYLGNLAEFDPLEHGVMPNAVDGGEPDHFLALRAAHEALKDAGYLATDIAGAKSEVIIGRGSYVNRGNTTAIQHGIIVDQVLRILKQLHPEHTGEELVAVKQALKSSLPPFHAETAPALVPNIISGRIANRLDLMGPNYIVDAACASSLVAVDLGMRDLRSGRCDLAVVGGVHASTPPVITMIFCQLKAISRTGQIRPFDRSADGTLLGEGVGMLVLKRLEDAERAGNRIYAVLKEIGTASDGRALGPLAPRVEGEELALRRAYEGAGIDPQTIGLLEAHGTGTVVGDAVEIEALRRVFGTPNGSTRALGSVKSMIGHLMPASGIAALIKVALALHHKVLPPTLNCDDPNPALDLATSGFYINGEARPWLHGRRDTPRRAGVNAFGFGGINAHAVLEEHPAGAETFSFAHRWETELVILSASSRAGLAESAAELRALVDAQGDVALKDLAFTLNVGSDLGPVRLAIVAGTTQDLAQKLERAEAALRDPRCTRLRDNNGVYFFDQPLAQQGSVAFVFPGEGSQYPNMLADLCLHFPVVRATFDFMDRAFIDHPRGYLPSEVIFPHEKKAPDRLWEMDTGAEAVFAANQAMAALLGALQIRPRFMTGHSTGEHSALLASGIIRVASEEELIEHVRGVNASFERLKLSDDIPGGVLVAVGGVDRSVLESLTERSGGSLHIALDNCPHQVVLCGTDASVEAAMRELQALRAICQRLPFQRAYHTPWFESFCEPLRAYFDRVRIGPSDVEVYSCVTAQPLPSDPDGVRSLVASQWARAVRFRDTVEAMYARGARIFVEVGPKSNLTGFIEDTLRGRTYMAIPSNTAHRSGITQLNHLLGQLVAQGVPMDLAALYARRDPKRVDLASGAKPVRPAKPSRRLRLKTGLQPLRLPADFVLPGLATRTKETAAPAHDVPPARPPSALRGSEGPITPSPSLSSPMLEHLETMDRFLRLQANVLGKYLRRRPAHRGSGNSVARPMAVLDAPPFIGDVEELVPGRRVVATRRIDPTEDRWIRDHVLGRQVSADDPELDALPVVPLTVSMEILAEVASLLQDRRLFVGMRDVRAYRWIALDDGLVTLRVTAEATSGHRGEVHAKIEGIGDQESGNRKRLAMSEPDGPPEAGRQASRMVFVEGTLLFADAYPAPRLADSFALTDERPSEWTSDRLYRDGMFHGPAFRSVRSVDRAGSDGASATLQTLTTHGLFASRPEPRFLMDPVLLDGAGQVLAFWAKERLETGVDVFPYRVSSLRLYGPVPSSGSQMTCRLRAGALGDDQTRCDFALVDAAGAVYCEVEGWEDRRFRLPRPLVSLQVDPQRTYLSRSWQTSIDGVAPPDEVACSRLDDLPETLLLGHGAIWLNVVAHLVLSRRERERWRGLPAAPARRCEWLLGRVVAKDAVRRLIAERFGVDLCPADVEVLPAESGRPCVSGSWQAALGCTVAVSISHVQGAAVALATFDADKLVGIDVERVSRRHDGFETAAFDQEELGRLTNVAGPTDEWLLRGWCAKEAAGKALGLGLSHGLLSLSVRDVDADAGGVTIQPRADLAERVPLLSGGPLRAFTRREDDLITAIVIAAPDARLAEAASTKLAESGRGAGD
ncbi:MAG: acyltransferase domain-containing protein [Luteitalea sp.]|nr:acyltransferase domain-containing protein [Luteitalea sp.]